MDKITLSDIEERSDLIYINSKGQLVYESILEKSFDGDLKLLLSCCENNIITGDVEEYINFNKAIEDYKRVMEVWNERV